MNNGKVAIVSGAGGGIGREIALELARTNASVVINDIGVSVTGEGGSSNPAEETKALLDELRVKSVIDTNSVDTWEGAQSIVETALKTFGRIDIIVNNAGILRDTIFHKMTPEQWLSVINVHLNGSFFLSRSAAEHFRNQQSGSYVHMTSTSGLIGNFGQANYSAAKLGICALSKSIALDMKRFNVHSNCIAPFAWSRMTNEIPADSEEQKLRVEKLKKMTPSKNAPLAAFLASDNAKKITGQIFGVRNNEIFLFNANRPIRSVQRNEGWDLESIEEHAIPSLKGNFVPLDRSGDIFSWDPI